MGADRRGDWLRGVGDAGGDGGVEDVRALRRHRVPVAGCIVVTRRNAAVVGEILDLFAELGVKLIALSRFSPAGYAAAHVAELLPSRSDMVTALSQAEARAGQHGLELQVTMPVPPCVIDHADYPHVRFGGCPIGTEAQELAKQYNITLLPTIILLKADGTEAGRIVETAPKSIEWALTDMISGRK